MAPRADDLLGRKINVYTLISDLCCVYRTRVFAHMQTVQQHNSEKQLGFNKWVNVLHLCLYFTAVYSRNAQLVHELACTHTVLSSFT